MEKQHESFELFKYGNIIRYLTAFNLIYLN